MSNYLNILIVLLFSVGAYLSFTSNFSRRKWRKTGKFEFKGIHKHLVISSVLFLIVLILTLIELKAHYKRHSYDGSPKKEVIKDIEEEEE